MSGSASRATTLNPSAIISLIENQYKTGKLRDEVYIRRAISALYFALFNYWSAKKYDSGIQGKGPHRDRWSLNEFNQEMLSKGLDAEIYFLYLCRVAADHYTLNPTIVELWDFQKNVRCFLNSTSIKRAIDCSKDLYRTI